MSYQPNVCQLNVFRPNVFWPNVCWLNIYWPNVCRPNVCWLNIYWPNVCRPNVCRPNVCQPNVCRSNVCRPKDVKPEALLVSKSAHLVKTCFSDEMRKEVFATNVINPLHCLLILNDNKLTCFKTTHSS
jgi:hypothetical protein